MACHDHVNTGPGGKRYNYYYNETAPLVHDSGAARGDDAMASMTNLRIIYRMYIRHSKIHYNLDCKGISYEIETGQKCVPRRFTRNDYACL